MTSRHTENLKLLESDAAPFRLIVADNAYSRGVGLLGKAYLDPDEAMLIIPCNFVHTLGMRFSIDVVFCDRDLKIVKITEELAPWRLSPLVRRAAAVIEFKAGTAKRAGIKVGMAFERSNRGKS